MNCLSFDSLPACHFSIPSMLLMEVNTFSRTSLLLFMKQKFAEVCKTVALVVSACVPAQSFHTAVVRSQVAFTNVHTRKSWHFFFVFIFYFFFILVILHHTYLSMVSGGDLCLCFTFSNSDRSLGPPSPRSNAFEHSTISFLKCPKWGLGTSTE